jgi:hypothetical protein
LEFSQKLEGMLNRGNVLEALVDKVLKSRLKVSDLDFGFKK